VPVTFGDIGPMDPDLADQALGELAVGVVIDDPDIR
jgi:hypothetical protein